MTTGYSGAFSCRARAKSWPVAMGFVLCLLAGSAAGALVTPSAVHAQSARRTAEVGERNAMVHTVASQIAALAQDDAQAAFAYAGAAIQRRFKTAEAFIDMVRREYAPVYRPKSVHFLDVDMQGGPPILRVALIGPDGGRWQAAYIMSRDPQGRWRIDGCTLIRLPGSTA